MGGEAVGCAVGTAVGTAVGSAVGGATVGSAVGTAVGTAVGSAVVNGTQENPWDHTPVSLVSAPSSHCSTPSLRYPTSHSASQDSPMKKVLFPLHSSAFRLS